MTTICIFEESDQTREFAHSKGLMGGSCKKLEDASYQLAFHKVTSKLDIESALDTAPDGDIKIL